MGILKTVVVLAGPTAVGKTAVAIAVAQALGTDIISADSRQCYRELNIGVARPSPAELHTVPHHFIASHSITQNVTAATFEAYALQTAHGLFKKFDTVVVAGGTGFYTDAFLNGLDAIPAVPESIRGEVQHAYLQNGLGWLQTQVLQEDPLFFQSAETTNPHRLLRALEVVRATGQSIQTFKKNKPAPRDFKVIKIGLDLPRLQLYARINQRVDAMLDAGLLDEVRALNSFAALNALQTVGYKELFSFLHGETDFATAVNAIKQNTRHYAKRQLTWLRKDAAYHWLPPAAEPVTEYLKMALSR